MPEPAEFTVGWICAVQVEYLAAQESLDVEYPALAEQPHNDSNVYKLGAIGKHNVVIACLPHRSYGTTSATVVSRDLLRTFPNIKFGLLVGVGGGCPTRTKDIRLGDVVVSVAHRDNSAVIQHDFGRAVQTKSFKITGHLDAPPPLLLAALQEVQVRHARFGNRLYESVNETLEKNSRLGKQYQRPPDSADRLFESTFLHIDSERPCDTTCALQEHHLIHRPKRDEEEENITEVHYGPIASGNALIQDAVLRDRLAEERSVLSLEMEAAGLMNHFKCLVIRGIGNYADTHKNDEWQGYAAMVAAVYAKELLGTIPPFKVAVSRSLDPWESKYRDRMHAEFLCVYA